KEIHYDSTSSMPSANAPFTTSHLITTRANFYLGAPRYETPLTSLNHTTRDYKR
ncbi:hypothetical protein A2U01_0094569, partial [Trifolium medium]|nr:hypothetical protein [Trifolium medium]